MKRPSRGLRESATTMLKNGRFLAPPRERRITTMCSTLKSEARDFTPVIAVTARKRTKSAADHREGKDGMRGPATRTAGFPLLFFFNYLALLSTAFGEPKRLSRNVTTT